MRFVSDRLAEMNCYSIEEKEEFLGKSVFDFIDPSNHHLLMENIRKLLAGEKDHRLTEYLAIKKDHSRFHIDVNSTVLLDSTGNRPAFCLSNATSPNASGRKRRSSRAPGSWKPSYRPRPTASG